jgi:hypothetical protein
VRSHDLIRLLDEPGPERWGRPLQISFLDLPRKYGFRGGGRRNSRSAAALAATVSRIRGFVRPGH